MDWGGSLAAGRFGGQHNFKARDSLLARRASKRRLKGDRRTTRLRQTAAKPSSLTGCNPFCSINFRHLAGGTSKPRGHLRVDFDEGSRMRKLLSHVGLCLCLLIAALVLGCRSKKPAPPAQPDSTSQSDESA